jgi:hypothetical protein
MVWHIFKKDWKLLWPFFLAVAAIQFIPAAIRAKLGLFGEDPVLEYVLLPATAVAIFATALLAVAIVQQDSIPGVRQDWLIRPVKRRDLLFAKLFFVVVLVEGVAIAASTFQVLASGFSFRESLTAAIIQNAFLALVIVLPALALASVTRNTVESVIGAIVIYLGGSALLIAFTIAHGGNEFIASFGTGAGWITQLAGLILILVGACVVLGMQYFRCQTKVARGVIAISSVLFVIVLELLPWGPLFAFQQHLSPHPNAAKSMSLFFDPSLGKYQQPSGLTMSDEETRKQRAKQGSPALFLPIRISGVPNDSILEADKSEFRLISSDGKVVYRGHGEDLEVRKEGLSDGQATAYYELDIPETAYSRFKNQTLLLEIHYSLTLFRLGSAFGIPALAGDVRSPKLGWCETQMDKSGTAVELRCMQAGNGPACATAFLENPSTGMRSPSLSGCEPNYTPRLFLRTDADPTSHYGLNLRFRDPSGLIHYPIDGPQLPTAQVVLRFYEPEDHFTRNLIIPAIKLQEWESR